MTRRGDWRRSNHKKRNISKPNGQVQLSLTYTPSATGAESRPDQTEDEEAAHEQRLKENLRHRRRTTALSGCIGAIRYLRNSDGGVMPATGFLEKEMETTEADKSGGIFSMLKTAGLSWKSTAPLARTGSHGLAHTVP